MKDVWRRAWMQLNKGCSCKSCRTLNKYGKESGYVRAKLKALNRKDEKEEH